MVTIGGFVIDAVPLEDHNLDSATTEHPIEEGADVTDHIRTLPDRVTIQGIVSNTPIGPLAAERQSAAAGSTLPADSALAFLRKIREDREPVRVETNILVYPNMVLVNLSIPQTAQTGDSFQFRATFQQLQIVKTERTSVRVAVPIADKKSNKGTKASKEVSESDKLTAARVKQAELRRSQGKTFDFNLIGPL